MYSLNYFLTWIILILLKRYEVDRRTWLLVPSGTLWSTGSDTYQVVEIQKEVLLRCIHHLRSDLSDNMGHMRILGTEPSLVIRSFKC